MAVAGPSYTCVCAAERTACAKENLALGYGRGWWLPSRRTGVECAWLKAAPLPKTFVLELLDFVLAENASVFRGSAVFEHALLSRVCHLLLAQLHDLLDPTLEVWECHRRHHRR